ncbi:MAG: TIR domain-containing protein [Dehalococcoidia bacterium]
MSVDRTHAAYEFLSSRRGKTFTVDELAGASGWKPTTVRTYVAKKWHAFLRREGPNEYTVATFDLSEEQFTGLQTQVTATPVFEPEYDYDVTLSFAGEDREYVERVASALHELGVRVFYDRYEEVDLWGKNLYVHLDDVYRKRSQYCVIFVSQHYADKVWTNHERESAQARALSEKSEYILPVRFDGTDLPGILPTTAYVDGNKYEPSGLALIIAQKTGLDTDLAGMLAYLRSWLPDYTIELEGTQVRFQCQVESYDGSFPARLLVEMYRQDMLDSMFLMPAIVPI